MRTLPLLLLLLLCQSLIPAWAEPLRYRVDPAHTQIGFAVERFGFNRVLGRFDGVQGELWFDEAEPTRSTVRVTVAMAGLSSGDAQRDEHLRGARWLNASEHAQAQFVSGAIRPLGEGRFAVEGQLTLLGQTQPIQLEMRINRVAAYPPNPKQRVVGFSGSAALSRQQFGLRTASTLIGDAVTLQIELLAVPE